MLFGPIAQTSSGCSGQMLDDRGAEDLKEKIFVGFLVLPAPTGFLLSFGTRANGNKDQAVGFSLLERALQSLPLLNCVPSMQMEPPLISKLSACRA